MSLRPIHALAAVTGLGVALLTLTRCEVLVDLDRSEVDGGDEQGCAICTDLTEGGEDAGQDGSEEAGSEDGGDTGSTGSGRDASPGDGGGESATTDSGAGG